MKSEEKNYLSKSKFFQGKTSNQIHLEISNLINSQKLFKKQGKEIKQLNKTIEKLKKKLKLKKQKEFLRGLRQERKKPIILKENPRYFRKIANVHHLKRIITLIKFTKKPTSLREIYVSCMISKEQALSGTLFLLNHKLIQKKGGFYLK